MCKQLILLRNYIQIEYLQLEVKPSILLLNNFLFTDSCSLRYNKVKYKDQEKYNFYWNLKYTFPPPPVNISLAKFYTKNQNYKIYSIYKVIHVKKPFTFWLIRLLFILPPL